MTQEEFNSIPGSNDIPQYDEDDAEGYKLDDPNVVGHKSVAKLKEAWELVTKGWNVFGGIRYHDDGRTSIYAYFRQ